VAGENTFAQQRKIRQLAAKDTAKILRKQRVQIVSNFNTEDNCKLWPGPHLNSFSLLN